MMMKNSEWVQLLKEQGIYDILKSGITVREMAVKLAKGRDPRQMEYKVQTMLQCLPIREANPDNFIG